MPQPILTDEQFREAAQSGSAPADAQVRKGFVTEVKAPTDGEDTRTLDFIISTAAVDRMGDTIAVDGWKLANFRKNPVVLWAHDASMLPIAKASNIRVEDGKLMARAEFMPREISGFSDAVYRALKAGFLSACSVGFAPIKYAFSEDSGRRFGIDFLECELLEFSVVPVPANQEALVQGRSAGLALANGSPLRAWVDETAKAAGIAMLPAKQLEALLALPTLFRTLADKLPPKANGARGQMLRCANIAEKQIKADAAPVVEDEPIVVEDDDADAPALIVDPPAKDGPVATPRLTMARRRLDLARRRLA